MTNLVSKIFGNIANIKFPSFLQNYINKKYIKHFDIDMSEFKKYNDYKSLNALFTRSLEKQRDFSLNTVDFISPSDGICFEYAMSDKMTALSVKNRIYKIDELLDDTLNKTEQTKNFCYANIYLSPRDYHHYHAPCDLQIIKALYIPAKLYSVSKKYLIKIPNLYCKNERVVLKCKMPNGGILWMVFVGALNVGKMKFDFDENIQTNAKILQKSMYKYENLFVKKGDHLGNFELGSTIVLIAQKEALKFNFIKEKPLKFGQTIAKIL